MDLKRSRLSLVCSLLMSKDDNFIRLEIAIRVFKALSRESDPSDRKLYDDQVELLRRLQENKKYRGVKESYPETIEFARGLSPDTYKEVRAEILSEFSIDISRERQSERSKVEKVIKRGVIKNDMEYRLVVQAIEDADTNNDTYIILLDNLMMAYNFRKKN
ncbi:MAG: hypothetical protein EOP48_08695 [Sphingobacteriales bacterium]|nr:MAG: hypothetical protein EOP48_08695 [Sphingobacteriales bacterium]